MQLEMCENNISSEIQRQRGRERERTKEQYDTKLKRAMSDCTEPTAFTTNNKYYFAFFSKHSFQTEIGSLKIFEKKKNNNYILEWKFNKFLVFISCCFFFFFNRFSNRIRARVLLCPYQHYCFCAKYLYVWFEQVCMCCSQKKNTHNFFF